MIETFEKKINELKKDLQFSAKYELANRSDWNQLSNDELKVRFAAVEELINEFSVILAYYRAESDRIMRRDNDSVLPYNMSNLKSPYQPMESKQELEKIRSEREKVASKMDKLIKRKTLIECELQKREKLTLVDENNNEQLSSSNDNLAQSSQKAENGNDFLTDLKKWQEMSEDSTLVRNKMNKHCQQQILDNLRQKRPSTASKVM